jgi:hypothetical protein
VGRADDYVRTNWNKLTPSLVVIMRRGRMKGQIGENCEDPPPSSYGQYKAQSHRLDMNPDPVGCNQIIMQLREALWVDVMESEPPFQREVN